MSGWGWLEVKFFAERWQKCGCGTSLISKTQTCLLWLCASLSESQRKLADQNVCNMKLRFQISAIFLTYQVKICQAAKWNVRTHVRIYAPWILPQQVNAQMSVAWNLPNHTSQHMSEYASEQMAHPVKRQVSGRGHCQNPPAPKVLGRDRPDGTRKRLQVYLGGGPFFGQNLLFLIGRDARLQKTL